MDTTPTKDVEQAHTEYLANLNPAKMMEYLLDASPYLKTGDLDGWLKHFKPSPPILPVQPKKRKASPMKVWGQEDSACTNCKQFTIVDDVAQGSVVCINCGLIAIFQQVDNKLKNIPYTDVIRGGAYVVHRYSRLVYFRAIVKQFNGLTNPPLPEEDVNVMRRFYDGHHSHEHLKDVIQTRGLPRRYLRHVFTIQLLLDKNCILYIPADVYFEMCRMFRYVEHCWDHGFKIPNRKSFFSYRLLYCQFAYHLGHSHELVQRKIKRSPIIQSQIQWYGRIAATRNWRVWDPQTLEPVTKEDADEMGEEVKGKIGHSQKKRAAQETCVSSTTLSSSLCTNCDTGNDKNTF